MLVVLSATVLAPFIYNSIDGRERATFRCFALAILAEEVPLPTVDDDLKTLQVCFPQVGFSIAPDHTNGLERPLCSKRDLR
jgi:hypothetical protein